MAQTLPWHMPVKAHCLEVECPHWGIVRIGFWDLERHITGCECRGLDVEFSFTCPACGETHEIDFFA
jgi:hypothetical protein